jgi:hypothetical protein
MQNIVLIPCWRRDDFLAVTLDFIKEANGADKNHYVFLIDRNFHSSVVDVAKNFPLDRSLRFSPQHRYHGNSYNVLEGYRYALQIAAEKQSQLVYLIEEDIWVGKDFFDFHERVQSQHDCFCLSAVRNQMHDTVYPAEPESVYHHFGYQSLGVSFKPRHLSTIVKHAGLDFYRHMLSYVRRHFPKSRYGNAWCEQDGLINRIAETSPVQPLYPYVPRAYHAGFVGYNRQGKPLEGSLPDRINTLKTMTAEEMNDRALQYKDITKIPLEVDYGVQQYVLKE